MAQVLSADLLSQGMKERIAALVGDEAERLRDQPSPPIEEMELAREMGRSFQLAAIRPARRPRSPDSAANEGHKRPCQEPSPPQISTPLPQRDPRLRPRELPVPAHSQGQTYAGAVRAPTQPPDMTKNQGAASSTARDTAPPPPPPAAKRPRLPPLIVEYLPDWVRHFKNLKKLLNCAPNARPYGKGVRFTPRSEDEYRVIQRYLSDLEKTEKISWFSYQLPAERSLKVAIRGIPADTPVEDIADALTELGYVPEYIRQIKARQGRPGCIFHAQIKRTPGITPGIYAIDELLCMPGVKIEAWRGKNGPAQCHRCQSFRHSSHGCHRKMACVRCGGEHVARDCPRPREEPPTCANCGENHTANNPACPVFKREIRNRKAGTAPRTTGQLAGRDRTLPGGTNESNLMAAANPATERGKQLPEKPRKKKRGKKKKKGKRKDAPTEAAPTKTQASAKTTRPLAVAAPTKYEAATQKAASSAAPQHESVKGKMAKQPLESSTSNNNHLMRAMINILMEVLVAVQTGADPLPVITAGLVKLSQLA